MKKIRESLICYQVTHVLLDVPSTDYSLSVGNFRGIFSLSKGWPLFLAISVCLLLEGRLSFHDFVFDRVLFHLKEFFRCCEKTSFWGKKSILKIPVYLRIFWSGVVGAIDTFVAEHIANMLS